MLPIDNLSTSKKAALYSLSLILANHESALSCQVKSRCLRLPDHYAPCVVPTVPSPNELLSKNWGQSRPKEYVQLLDNLIGSWRIFSTKRKVNLSSDPPSYFEQANTESPSVEDSPSLETSSNSASPRPSRTSNSPDWPNENCVRGKRYRKARAYFQPHHLFALENFYKHQTYLSTQDRELLAQRLGLSEDRIRTWFQNRRMREKRKPRFPLSTISNPVNLSTEKDVMGTK
uniref:Homeobox domain-containing protein n=1 Tax=Mesocestoides corti TaxID=53468 RepID=A0A5K3FXX2_MESCO